MFDAHWTCVRALCVSHTAAPFSAQEKIVNLLWQKHKIESNVLIQALCRPRFTKSKKRKMLCFSTSIGNYLIIKKDILLGMLQQPEG